jgi:[ribosomal protein S5]-alanine N-acetyltransferase
MGIELAPDYWGRFADAIEISQVLLQFGFKGLGLSAISVTTLSANTRAIRLAKWFGATVAASRPAAD